VPIRTHLYDSAESRGFERLADCDVTIERNQNCHPDGGRLRDESQRQQVDFDDLSLLHRAQSSVLEEICD